MKEKILIIVESEWRKGINPDVRQLKYDFGVCDIESENQFNLALEELVKSKKFLLDPVQKEYYVIIPYPTVPS